MNKSKAPACHRPYPKPLAVASGCMLLLLASMPAHADYKVELEAPKPLRELLVRLHGNRRLLDWLRAHDEVQLPDEVMEQLAR